MKPFRVLSIDFDFFQEVSEETLFLYPDGHDFSTQLSLFIWPAHYANPSEGPKIRAVTVNRALLDEMKQILLNNVSSKIKPVMVANSHKYIYDFIMDNYDERKYSGIDLVNVDMHHDMFNKNEELDCGNWVSHVCQQIPDYQVKWIANPVSQAAYGLGENLMQFIETNFDSIRAKKFDAIFLCRSDIWSPPHLDDSFDELYQLIVSNYRDVLVDRQVSKPRQFEQAVMEQKELYSQFNDTMSKIKGAL